MKSKIINYPYQNNYVLDREKIVPTLIRIFWNENKFNSLSEFEKEDITLKGIEIYHW